MKFENFRVKYAFFYLTALLFGGVATACFKYLSISLPISILSLVLLLSLPIFLLSYFAVLLHKRDDAVFFLISIVILGLLFKSIYYIPDVDFNSLINTLYYISIFLSISLCFGLNKVASQKIFKFVYLSMAILAVIGLLQFLFHEYLPNAFVELPVIKSEFAQTNYKRDIDGFILYTVNGLYNNPIVYGSTLLFPLMISLHNTYKGGSIIDLVILLLCSLVIILMTSRVNITSAVLLVLIISLLKSSTKTFLYLLLIVNAIFLLIVTFFKGSPIFTLVLNRFTGNDEWVSVSNEEHISDSVNALTHISENIIMGLNINEYAKKDIITDGSWFIFPLEFSPIIAILMFFMFLIMSHKAWIVSKISNIPNFAPLFLLLVVGGFFNSFLVDKASLSIILVLYSLLYNMSFRVDNV